MAIHYLVPLCVTEFSHRIGAAAAVVAVVVVEIKFGLERMCNRIMASTQWISNTVRFTADSNSFLCSLQKCSHKPNTVHNIVPNG